MAAIWRLISARLGSSFAAAALGAGGATSSLRKAKVKQFNLIAHAPRGEHLLVGVKGDTSGKVLKPAKISTGFAIGVPIFVAQGDVVGADRCGGFVHRA